MRRRAVRWASVGLAALLALLAAACDDSGGGAGTTSSGAEPTPPATTPIRGGSIAIGLYGENTSGWYLPETGCANYCAYVTNNLFDPLMRVGADGKPAPWLALSATPNADATVWTIKLRQGVKFHDGEPFNATAVKANMDAGKAGSALTLALVPLKETKVIDEYTVELDTTPWGALPYSMSAQGFMMEAPAQIAAKDKNHPIGTGPFKFQDSVPNEHLTLVRNENYWYKDPDSGDQLPYLDEVTFKPFLDSSAREAALRSGQVDVMQSANGQEIARFKDDKGFQTVLQDKPAYTDHYLINQLVPGLDDVRVRLALAYCIDREALRDLRNAGLTPVANGPFPPGSLGYLEDNGYPKARDVEKGKRLIADYEREKGTLPSFTLGSNTDPVNVVTNQLVQAQWLECGIKTEISPIEQTQYLTAAFMGSSLFQIFQWANHAYSDTDGNYYFWHSSLAAPAGQLAFNAGRMIDPEIDRLLDLQRSSLDPAVRKQASQDLNRIMGSKAEAIWSVWLVAGNIARPDVHGLSDFKLEDGQAATPEFFPGYLNLHNAWKS
jgi:peptide/nickel transport system substrate-binding protein